MPFMTVLLKTLVGLPEYCFVKTVKVTVTGLLFDQKPYYCIKVSTTPY